MHEKIIRKTPEFKALRTEAREVIAAYADGADFDYVISRLAPIGEEMAVLLALSAPPLGRGPNLPPSAGGFRIFASTVDLPWRETFFYRETARTIFPSGDQPRQASTTPTVP